MDFGDENMLRVEYNPLYQKDSFSVEVFFANLFTKREFHYLKENIPVKSVKINDCLFSVSKKIIDEDKEVSLTKRILKEL